MCVVPIEEGILAKLVLDTSHHGAVLLIIGGFRWEGVEGVYLVLVLVVGGNHVCLCWCWCRGWRSIG